MKQTTTKKLIVFTEKQAEYMEAVRKETGQSVVQQLRALVQREIDNQENA